MPHAAIRSVLVLLALSVPARGQDEDRPGIRPVAILRAPLRAGVDEPVRCSLEDSFAPDGGIASYELEIEFPGGSMTLSASEATHRFGAPGKYAVRGRIADRRGRTDQTETTIEVVESMPGLLDRIEARRRAASRSALVVAMVENGGRTPYGRFAEGDGKRLLGSLAAPLYGGVTILAGEGATPDAFFEALHAAGDAHDAVDVLVFAHGTEERYVLSGGGVKLDLPQGASCSFFNSTIAICVRPCMKQGFFCGPLF